MIKVDEIRSIGWLSAFNNRINLTPVFEGEQQPRTVNISREDFEEIRDCDDLMKVKAIEVLNKENKQ